MLRKRNIFCVLIQLLLILPVLVTAQVLPFQTVTYDECQIDFSVSKIISGDLDNDNDLDMLIFHGRDHRDFSVILSNGNNDFELSEVQEGRIQIFKPHFHDINGDGFPELTYLQDMQSEGFYYHLNNGEGGFEPVDTMQLDTEVYDYKFFDVTGDERKDLIFRMDSFSSYKENLGGGEFGETQFFADAFPEIFLDVNQDGEADFFQIWGSYLRLFINQGGFNFELADTVLTGFSGNLQGFPGHELTDLDDDNDLDVIILTAGSNRELRCLINDGDGNFRQSYQFEFDQWTKGMYQVNINDDQHPDIAVECNGFVYVFLGNGNGSLEFDTKLYTSGASTVMDSDNNGFADILTPNSRESNLGIMINEGTGFYNGEYLEISAELPYRSHTYAYYVDFESDGDPDVVQTTGSTGGEEFQYCWSLQLALNDGNGNFEIVDSLISLESDFDQHLTPYTSLFFDFTGDQRADLLLRDYANRNGFQLFESNDFYQFEETGSIELANDRSSNHMATLDFDNDGDLDFFSRDGQFEVKLWHNRGENGLELVDSIEGNLNFAFHFADINNDNALDFLSSTDCTSVAVVLNDGEGYFSEESFRFHTEDFYRPDHISSGDFNNDNLIDLVVECYFPYQDIQIFNQIENNEFEFHQSIRATGTPHIIDIDRDGALDIILSSGFTTVLLNDGNGNFEIENTYAFGHSNPLSIADYNGDGELDLVKAGDGGIYYTFQPGEWNQVGKNESVPSEFKMLFAYPNPFNSSFQLNYNVSTQRQAGVKVYDLRGRVLYNQDMAGGSKAISIDGSNWSTGAYFVNVEVGGEVQSVRVNCLK